MDPNASIRNVADLFAQIFDAVDDSLANDRYIPALMLMFSWIDIVSSLHRSAQDEDTSRKEFIGWLSKFAALESLGIKPIDVYAARCGTLHTGSPHSRLEKEGKARSISWIDPRGDNDALPTMRLRLARHPSGSIPVDIRAFRNRLVEAFGLYRTELEKNSSLQSSFLFHGSKVFATVMMKKKG